MLNLWDWIYHAIVFSPHPRNNYSIGFAFDVFTSESDIA